MTYMKKNLHFFNLKKTHYPRTDRRTDRPSYRDARTHLKMWRGIGRFKGFPIKKNIFHFYFNFLQGYNFLRLSPQWCVLVSVCLCLSVSVYPSICHCQSLSVFAVSQFVSFGLSIILSLLVCLSVYLCQSHLVTQVVFYLFLFSLDFKCFLCINDHNDQVFHPSGKR